jgi:hypothetical protein
MAVYQLTPFKATPTVLTPGMPAYVRGSYNDKTGPTLGNIISDSASGTVGTVTFQILSGNIPQVGFLITVVGTSNTGGAFNVINASILSVSTTTAGACTVTFSLASAAQSTTPDGGQVIIPQSEIGEALTSGSSGSTTYGASVPVVVPYNIIAGNLNQGMTVVVSFPSYPTSCTVVLQQAVQDLDGEYATIATVASVSGGTITGNSQITVDPTVGRFFRLLNQNVVGGTSPTIIGKFLI